MGARRRWAALGLFAFVYLYAFPYFGALRHANELPRVLTTQQLVHHGTFELGPRLDDLGSKADISTTPDGRYFQNKAPGLSVLGAIVYAPMAALYRLAGAGMPSLRVTTWLLRAAVVTLPMLFFLPAFWRVAERFADGDKLAQDAALLAVAFGCLLFPYAIVFMSHAPATVAVGLAFERAIRLVRGASGEHGKEPSPRRQALVVGGLLGLAMFLEYQAVFAALIVTLYVVARGPRRLRSLGALVLAALPSLLLLGAYHWACFGSPLRTGYAYSVDAANRVGVLGLVGPSQASVTQLLTYGSHGLFVLSPWILLAFLGAWTIVRDADLRAQVGAEALVAFAVVVTYLGFVACLQPEFGRGGWSVGPRYAAIAMPFFAWLAAAGLAATEGQPMIRVPAMATVFVGVIINLVAATTYPHWPETFENPLFEVSMRLLGDGRAPHSLGRAVGLEGLASLAPLYLVVAALSVGLALRGGLRRGHVAMASVLALAAVYRLNDFATTPEPNRSLYWDYVVSTYEP